eukprot:CAMPEP_0202882464 /NCGR_PEP_ID=MMETSP1391-20130828/38032_1 /ASSEMBLY_ACC=CAM_ASM_000867 /TAXON_ID=1034604 /ORGANISM="Chlamydomonas leiostraca, Strain SAG 11-49" /LENGTH=154 /DNA_ID=CAMNT_0049565321 /DNA_START=68 /DNA_END=529 /DNA_ORIENTATION=-
MGRGARIVYAPWAALYTLALLCFSSSDVPRVRAWQGSARSRIGGQGSSRKADVNRDIQPFDLGQVTLAAQSDQARAADLNTQYLLSLDPDRLLWTFRNNAGLPAPGLPYAGSWEDVNCEVRGQFMGHYLSALARVWAATGNATALARVTYAVGE